MTQSVERTDGELYCGGERLEGVPLVNAPGQALQLVGGDDRAPQVFPELGGRGAMLGEVALGNSRQQCGHLAGRRGARPGGGQWNGAAVHGGLPSGKPLLFSSSAPVVGTFRGRCGLKVTPDGADIRTSSAARGSPNSRVRLELPAIVSLWRNVDE